MDLLRILINIPGLIDIENNEGMTPLFLAKDIAVMTEFIKSGCSLVHKDSYKRTALTWHIMCNHVDVTRSLLDVMKRRMTSNILQTMNEQPFSHAHSLDMVSILAASNHCRQTIANDEFMLKNDTSHILRELEDCSDALQKKRLLRKIDRSNWQAAVWASMNTQPDINIKNKLQETLLHCAVKENCPDIVKKLFDKNIDIHAQNSKGETALHLAVYCNNLVCINLLLELASTLPGQDGKNILREAKDMDGSTALMIAVIENKLDIVELLLQHGASIFTKQLMHCVKKRL